MPPSAVSFLLTFPGSQFSHCSGCWFGASFRSLDDFAEKERQPETVYIRKKSLLPLTQNKCRQALMKQFFPFLHRVGLATQRTQFFFFRSFVVKIYMYQKAISRGLARLIVSQICVLEICWEASFLERFWNTRPRLSSCCGILWITMHGTIDAISI